VPNPAAMAERLAPEKRHAFVHNGKPPRSNAPLSSRAFQSLPSPMISPLLSPNGLRGGAGQKVFEWDQSLEEVNMYIELPKNVPTKLIQCVIQAGHVEVGIRGHPPYLNVRDLLSLSFNSIPLELVLNIELFLDLCLYL
jgi:hypothetical protein